MSGSRVLSASTRQPESWQGLRAETLFVMPCTDLPWARRAATLMVERAGAALQVLMVEDLDGWGFVRIANQVFRATQGSRFGYVAQDAFAGRQWLALALKLEGRGLTAFNDGKWQGAIASFGLLDRRWAQGNYPDQALFFPGYERHFADVELSLLAMNDSCYCYEPASLLVEVDWHKDHAAVSERDHRLYQARIAAGIDGRIHSPELLRHVI